MRRYFNLRSTNIGTLIPAARTSFLLPDHSSKRKNASSSSDISRRSESGLEILHHCLDRLSSLEKDLAIRRGDPERIRSDYRKLIIPTVDKSEFQNLPGNSVSAEDITVFARCLSALSVKATNPLPTRTVLRILRLFREHLDLDTSAVGGWGKPSFYTFNSSSAILEWCIEMKKNEIYASRLEEEINSVLKAAFSIALTRWRKAEQLQQPAKSRGLKKYGGASGGHNMTPVNLTQKHLTPKRLINLLQGAWYSQQVKEEEMERSQALAVGSAGVNLVPFLRRGGRDISSFLTAVNSSSSSDPEAIDPKGLIPRSFEEEDVQLLADTLAQRLSDGSRWKTNPMTGYRSRIEPKRKNEENPGPELFEAIQVLQSLGEMRVRHQALVALSIPVIQRSMTIISPTRNLLLLSAFLRLGLRCSAHDGKEGGETALAPDSDDLERVYSSFIKSMILALNLKKLPADQFSAALHLFVEHGLRFTPDEARSAEVLTIMDSVWLHTRRHDRTPEYEVPLSERISTEWLVDVQYSLGQLGIVQPRFFILVCRHMALEAALPQGPVQSPGAGWRRILEKRTIPLFYLIKFLSAAESIETSPKLQLTLQLAELETSWTEVVPGTINGVMRLLGRASYRYVLQQDAVLRQGVDDLLSIWRPNLGSVSLQIEHTLVAKEEEDRGEEAEAGFAPDGLDPRIVCHDALSVLPCTTSFQALQSVLAVLSGRLSQVGGGEKSSPPLTLPMVRDILVALQRSGETIRGFKNKLNNNQEGEDHEVNDGGRGARGGVALLDSDTKQSMENILQLGQIIFRQLAMSLREVPLTGSIGQDQHLLQQMTRAYCNASPIHALHQKEGIESATIRHHFFPRALAFQAVRSANEVIERYRAQVEEVTANAIEAGDETGTRSNRKLLSADTLQLSINFLDSIAAHLDSYTDEGEARGITAQPRKKIRELIQLKAETDRRTRQRETPQSDRLVRVPAIGLFENEEEGSHEGDDIDVSSELRQSPGRGSSLAPPLAGPAVSQSSAAASTKEVGINDEDDMKF